MGALAGLFTGWLVSVIYRDGIITQLESRLAMREGKIMAMQNRIDAREQELSEIKSKINTLVDRGIKVV